MTPGLPVAGHPRHQLSPERDHEIAALVGRFYEIARSDPVLGPVFDRHVKDWDAHLEKMRRFWSAAIYQTGGYSGRPLDAHRRIDEIRPEHFPRWLGLWRRAVDETVGSEAREPFEVLASRMASSMSARVKTDPNSL